MEKKEINFAVTYVAKSNTLLRLGLSRDQAVDLIATLADQLRAKSQTIDVDLFGRIEAESESEGASN